MPTDEPAAVESAPSFLAFLRAILAICGVAIVVLAATDRHGSSLDLAFGALLVIGAIVGPRRAP